MSITRVNTTSFTGGRYAAPTLVDVASLAKRKATLQNKLTELYKQLKTATGDNIERIEKQIKNLEIQILSLEEQAYRATT